jgi:hypothetical protein
VLAKQQGHSAPPSPAKADGETKSADVPSPRDAKDAKDAESDLLASIGIAMYSRPTTLAKDEFAAVKAQAMRCWDIPAGWTEPRQVSVTVRFRLNPDGTLDGAPSVVQFPASELGKAAAVSAVEAVVQCGPFQLPADKYDQWDDIQLRFEP